MPEEQKQQLGPTEELLAQEQAAAVAKSQRLVPEAAPQEPASSLEAEPEQPASWLEAPQNEGTLGHPSPDTSPASPGKEQHQQAVAEETREPGGGMQKTISTKTQLGAVVTLDGAYVVPRYQTTVKETPSQSRGRDFTREQDNRQREQDRDLER